MKICIGIISYLPDEIEKRQIRFKQCQNLLEQCDSIFNVPIIIICQNYKDEVLYSKNLIRYDYEKLGIVNARKTLRNKFLQSDFDYIILNDDDISIIGDYNEGQLFLQEIERVNEQCIVQNATLFSGFCISKNLFSQIDIPNLEAANGEGFEDFAFYKILSFLINKTPRKIKTKIIFRHSFGTSTWGNKELFLKSKQMQDHTLEYINKVIEEYKQQNTKE